MAKKNKQKYKFTKTSIIVFLVITIILSAITFIFKDKIEAYLNSDNVSSVIDYNGLVMHTIDVGQAEAIMLKLPDGKNMLVDSGERGSEKTELLKSYLNNNYFSETENKEIDYFIITHSDSDHCGGAPMIFETYIVNKVFRPNIFSDRVASESSLAPENAKWATSVIWGDTITKMYEENCEVEFSKAGIEIIEETYSIKFLAPTEDYYSDVNSFSPIIVVEYENRRIMLTGDATSTTETKALNNLFECDILNVAHHGSSTSTCEEFLEKVKPDYAIISCNSEDSNDYGHPHQVVLNRLLNYMPEKNIYRTDLNGNIILCIKNNGEIAIALDVQITHAKIKAEYVLVGAVAVLFVICFSVSFSKKRKSTEKN